MTEDESIRAVVARWLEATAKGDIQAVLELMTDDALFLVPGHPPWTGLHSRRHPKRRRARPCRSTANPTSRRSTYPETWPISGHT